MIQAQIAQTCHTHRDTPVKLHRTSTARWPGDSGTDSPNMSHTHRTHLSNYTAPPQQGGQVIQAQIAQTCHTHRNTPVKLHRTSTARWPGDSGTDSPNMSHTHTETHLSDYTAPPQPGGQVIQAQILQTCHTHRNTPVKLHRTSTARWPGDSGTDSPNMSHTQKHTCQITPHLHSQVIQAQILQTCHTHRNTPVKLHRTSTARWPGDSGTDSPNMSHTQRDTPVKLHRTSTARWPGDSGTDSPNMSHTQTQKHTCQITPHLHSQVIQAQIVQTCHTHTQRETHLSNYTAPPQPGD